MNTRPASLLLLALLSAVAASQGDASEVYAVDPDRSRIGFVIGHLGIKKVKGDFTNFTARITYRDGDKDGVTADAVIKVASIDTGWQARDEYVQGPDFFLSREYPEIRFEADHVEREEGVTFLVGTFTMRGTSRRLKLPFILERSAETGDGNKQLRLKAETRIDRHDYGVGSKKMTDKLVGRMVTLSLDIVATSRHAADTTDVSAKP